MDIHELRECVRETTILYEEVQGLRKDNKRSFTIVDYIEMFRQKLIFTDHGERDRFFMPMHIASKKLDELTDMPKERINSRFATTKTKLLSIMGRYIKDLLRGFEEYDAELNSIRRNL